MSMKNSNDTIGNRTCDLPTCSADRQNRTCNIHHVVAEWFVLLLHILARIPDVVTDLLRNNYSGGQDISYHDVVHDFPQFLRASAV